MHTIKSPGILSAKIFLPVLLLVTKASAQEPIGLMNDNYLPSSSVIYNPASAFTSPFQWDINLVSADVFAYNNLVHANRTSLLTLLANSNNTSVDAHHPNTMRGFAGASIQGPSFIYHQNSFSFGIITQVRSAASTVSAQVPFNLDLNNIAEDTLYPFPTDKAAGLNWMEVGVNLGKSIPTQEGYGLFAAININYLAGWDGMSAEIEQPLHFVQHSQPDTISFTSVVMNYGYTSGLSSDVSQNVTSFQFKGSGVSIAPGIWMTDGNDDPENYRWKGGLSLIDFGFISFSRNVQQFQLTTDESMDVNLENLKNVSNGDEFTQLVSSAIAGKGSLTSTDGPLRIWLPAALALQGEVALQHHFFIHGLAIQRIILSPQQVLRPNSITLTPRYETKHFAAGIPIDWYDYHRLMVGGYVRLGPLVLGSDNLAAWFLPSAFEGADFYVGLHLHPFKNDESSAHHYSAKSGSGTRTGGFNCPKF